MLPPLNGGLLPAGRHPATLEDIRQRFVVEAPHPQHRDAIFHALMSWAIQVWQQLPGAHLWVDGGFVTHKEAPPKDVDVVAAARMAEIEVADVNALGALLTDDSGDTRVQPMGGLVDGFLTVRGDAAYAAYWDRLWSKVRGDDGNEREGVTKGYVVVRPE